MLASYDPRARRMPTSGGSGRTGSHDYYNADGPGGSTIDYGPHGPRDLTPSYTPDPLTNPGYFVQTDPAVEAQRDQAIAASHAANRAAYGADPAYAEAAAGGDLKAAIARMTQMKQAAQQQRFVDQGGSPETWNNRFDTAWPVPASPTGNYQYGPGRPGPTPPGVAQGGVRRGATPGASTGSGGVNGPQTMEAYGTPSWMQQPQGDWANAATGRAGSPGIVPAGLGGQFGLAPQFANLQQLLGAATGGYQPGQSKSGMGQGVNYLGASTGQGALGAYPSMQNMAALMQQGMPMGGNLYNPEAATMGRGIGPLLPPGFGGGGRTPINPGGPTQFPVNPGNRPGSVNDFLASLMAGNQMSPAMPGFQGQTAFSMDPGMMMFGYQPAYR